MRRNILTTNLTKAFIESKISQEAIMSKYLNIPINTIKKCIENNSLIPSVFRDDDYYGSMGFAYNKRGKLKVRDFGGVGTFMDIYDTVAYVLSLVYNRRIDTSNKQDFYFVLKHIARTFSKEIDSQDVINQDGIISDAILKSKNRKPIIEIAPRSWNKQDKEIWNHWGISLSYLNTHFVIPVDQYYIDRTPNSNPKYYYRSKDPCYAYMLGQNRQGIYLIKLYFPLRDREKELKFITNCSVLEGLPNLERDDYDYILITKSSKDRLSIGNHIVNHPLFKGGSDIPLKVGVINLPSENYRLKQNEYDWLINKLSSNGMIFSLLDFDRTGRNGAKYLEETYNIPYLFITNGELDLPNIGCKDFSDLHDKYNIAEIDKMVKDTFKYIQIKFGNYEDSENSIFGKLSERDLPY